MMPLKRILLTVVALAVLCCVTSASAAEYKKMTIRAATANPLGSLHVTGIEKFKEVVEKESGGAIRVQTFYGGSMGDEQANVKQLRNAEIQVACLAGGNLTPFAPASTLFVMPYIFPTPEEALRLFSNDAFMSKMADAIAAQSRVRPVAWFVDGYRHLTNSRKPVTQMADLQGLKIRVPPVEVQLESYKSWGVESHPLAWTETFNGLQQGVVDGQDNSYTVIRDQKFWEVQKYITELHYTFFVAPLLVSETWYRKLDDATRALIKKAALEAQKHEWSWAAEQEIVARNELLSHGMQLSKLEDEEKWLQAARGTWERFYDKVGGKAVVDEALAVMKTK